jgi:hypothetical protein
MVDRCAGATVLLKGASGRSKKLTVTRLRPFESLPRPNDVALELVAHVVAKVPHGLSKLRHSVGRRDTSWRVETEEKLSTGQTPVSMLDNTSRFSEITWPRFSKGARIVVDEHPVSFAVLERIADSDERLTETCGEVGRYIGTPTSAFGLAGGASRPSGVLGF